MAAKYFLKSDNDDLQEFGDVDHLARFMHVANHDAGEFFVNNYNGIKIKYDIQTGDVSPIATKSPAWLTYVFSEAAFRALIIPVKEAISLLAKLEILLELAKCDPEIGQIVRQRHLDENGNTKEFNSQSVEDTLHLILKYVSPVHERPLFGMFKMKENLPSAKHLAIYNVLKTVDFEAITSRNAALDIIRNLKDYSVSPKNISS